MNELKEKRNFEYMHALIHESQADLVKSTIRTHILIIKRVLIK
jgi:hypothetical protein